MRYRQDIRALPKGTFLLDISEVQDQLFHTYSTLTSTDVPAETHIEQLLRGELTLAPHPVVQIGPEFTWNSDPLEDANWQFQFHTLVWLDRLRSEATHLGVMEGIVLYENLIQSWIKGNPQIDPPSDYSWFDMAVGLRAIVLLQAVTHFGPQPWLVDAIQDHGAHLADPTNYEGRGNHSLHQDMGLLAIGHYLEQRDWVALAVTRISKMFTEAIDEEGVCREGSADYHYRNYRWYDEAARRMRAAGVNVPEELDQTLAKMPTFMAHATSPSANYALIGDTLKHKAPIIKGTATEWVRDGSKAPGDLVAFFDAGYLFARNRWETWKRNEAANFFTLRFGPGRSAAVHGHEDAGSITFDAFGETLLRDSGLYAYEAGEYRLYFRGRSSHNVIDVPGRKYYPSADSPLTYRTTSKDFVAANVHVKGLQGTSWHRSIFHSPRHCFTVVDDRVRVNESGPVHQLWHLPATTQFQIEPSAGAVLAITGSGNQVRFTPLGHAADVGVSEGQTDPISGWQSDEYNKRYPSPTLRFVQFGEQLRFSTLIDSRPAGSQNRLTVMRVERSSRRLVLVMTDGESTFTVDMQNDYTGFKISPNGTETDHPTTRS